MIQCAECGKLYDPPRINSVVCSPQCRSAYRQRIARERTRQWHLDHPGYAAARNAMNRQPPKFADCKHCGQPFHSRAGAVFCSISCRGKYRRRTKPEWYRSAHARNKAQYNAQSLARYYKARQNRPWLILIEVAAVRARKREIPYDLTAEWAAARWTGRCENTGIPFILGDGIRGVFSPSLDQIEASKGYTKDNCRFILWAINSMKGAGTDSEMMLIARAMLHHGPPIEAVLSLPG